MVARPYWITDQLAIVPRPRGGDWLDDEMLALREAGLDVIVSMLQYDETEELGLGDEAIAAQQAGMQFVNFPVPDRDVPQSIAEFHPFLSALEEHLTHAKRIGVHCRACIGRASVTSASLLIRSGMSADEAWLKIPLARNCPVPDTQEQRNWVDRAIRRGDVL